MRLTTRVVLSCCAALTLCHTTPAAAPLPKPAPETVRKELEPLWHDLLSHDELTASRATLKLAARPDHAVAFLKERLHPLHLSKERATHLLRELARGKEQVGRAALEEFT